MLRLCAAVCLACLPFVAIAGPAGLIQVVDGDTWDVGGERVRLFGIDAPETDQTCERSSGEFWNCGAWVTEQVQLRYGRKSATCETVDRDRYDRIVARCDVEGADVGQDLVLDGLAFAYRRYSMTYDLEEKSAVVNARGIHTSRVENPAVFRQAKRSASQPSRGPCRIKGNISSNGAHIYHMPGQELYADSDFDIERRALVLFCIAGRTVGLAPGAPVRAAN